MEPAAGENPAGASHVKSYESETVCPSAEMICHSTVYSPESPSAAAVVIVGPSTSTQPSSKYSPSGPTTRKANPESVSPMSSRRSFVVIANDSGSSVRVLSAAGVAETR